MKARTGISLVVVSLVLPLALVLAGPGTAFAKAAKPSISCSVSGSATISPGVSNTPAKQTLTVTLTLSSCTGSSVPGVTGSSAGTTSSTGKTTETCADLGKPSKPVTTNTTIDWNNDLTSAVSYKTVLDGVNGTSTGKVKSGAFAKGKISASISYVPGSGQDCANVPLTSATISGTFTIT